MDKGDREWRIQVTEASSVNGNAGRDFRDWDGVNSTYIKASRVIDDVCMRCAQEIASHIERMMSKADKSA
jgi:hypothetical protein